MYVKKKIRNLMQDFDNEVKLPTRFNFYVDTIKRSHKLIIKSKNGYHCDNCQCDFNKKRTKIQYSERYMKCPQCKKWLIVKTDRKRKYIQSDQFCIIEKFKEYWIMRLFAVETIYTSK